MQSKTKYIITLINSVNSLILTAFLILYSPLQSLFLSGISNASLTAKIIDYSIFKSQNLQEIQLTSNEIAHLNDVRNLILGIWLIISINCLILLLFWQKKHFAFLAIWKDTIIISTVILAIVGAFSLINFHQSFVFLHQIIFWNGNWAFDPATSKLIQAFPEIIFVNFVKLYVLLYYIFQIVIYLLINKTWKDKL